MSEDEFAGLVDALAADPVGSAQLTDLLREEHPVYDGRGTATVVRMRGWILLALARSGLSDQALIFVLEELDTGIDAYLVAAAARALRSYAQPNETLAPFVDACPQPDPIPRRTDVVRELRRVRHVIHRDERGIRIAGNPRLARSERARGSARARAAAR